MNRPFFTVTAPRAPMSPLVVEVPHASTWASAEHLALFGMPARYLASEADLYVDELYERAPDAGATLLVGGISRFVVDLNRAEEDVDAELVDGAPRRTGTTQGCLWKTTSDGRYVHTRRLSRQEWAERVLQIYRPYHHALMAAIYERQQRFGYAILLCGHSMPTAATKADVVPGTRGGLSCAPRVTELVLAHAEKSAFHTVIDKPYPGGYSTRNYGRPSDGVHAIQVELSRSLYMNEVYAAKSDGFEPIKAWCTELCAQLARLSLDRP